MTNNLTNEEIDYAINKQIPEIRRGLVIQTNYGELRIDDPYFCRAVAGLIKNHLKSQADAITE